VAYDPDVAPDPSEWLKLDEQERLLLVHDFHRAGAIQLPNVRAHAAIHVVVENQLAAGLPTVGATLDRLMRDGLNRHAAIHAIGTALAAQIRDQVSTATSFDQATYDARLGELTAAQFRDV
jgi:hypothetical protein